MSEKPHLFRHLSPHELSGSEIVKSKEIKERGVQEGELPANLFKVHILGDSGVGKTSLRKNLMGEKFDPNEKNTSGIEIHKSTVDDKWRSVKAGLVDFKTSLLWYTAGILSEERGAIKERSSSQIVDWQFIIFHLATFALASILGIFYFTVYASQNKVAIVCFLLTACLLIFADNISAYRLGGGFALIITLLDLLLENGQDVFSPYANHGEPILYLAFLSCMAMVGFLLGTIMGVGFRTGLVIAFTSMLAPATHLEVSVVYYEVLLVVFGSFVGGMLFVVTRVVLKGQSTMNKSCFLVLIFVIVVSIEFLGGPEKFRRCVRIFCAGYVVSSSMLAGLPVGRRVNAYFDAGKLKCLPLTVIVSCALAYMCGWVLPLRLNLPSAIGLTIFVILCSLEVYRKRFYNSPADADELTSMMVKYEALKKQNLPIVINFWDFAGDQFYYNTHHAFIAPYGLFFLVFDLRKFTERREMTLERLIFWLHSISTHADNQRSPIFLVGTHKHEVDLKLCEGIATDLKKFFYKNSSLYCNHLVVNEVDDTPLFTVENSIRNDTDIDILKQAIIRKVKLLMRNKFPIRWRKFYDHYLRGGVKYNGLMSTIKRFCSREKQHENAKSFETILKYREAVKFALNIEAIKNPEEMKNMLNYFHKAGYLIYLSDDPILSQYVVLNPQLIIHAMRSIVYVPALWERDEPNMVDKWSELEDKGVLHYDLLKHVISGLGEEINVMATLLQAFDFICPIGRIISPVHGFRQVERYLVPSKTPVDPETEKNPENRRTHLVGSQRIFYFDFGLFKPDSIFSRLVCKCIYLADSHKVFRNTASFTVDKDFRCNLYLEDHLPEQHLIKVVITSAGRANPFRYLGRLNNYVEAIRKREYSELDYICGVLCEYPSKEDELHEGCLKPEQLHVLPLARPAKAMEFPFAELGSTVTRFCNDNRYPIELTAKRRVPTATSVMPEEDLFEDNGYDDRQDVTHNSDNKMYDIYTICSQWDDDWVKDRLIPAVQIGLHERVHVRVNIYEQTEMNAMFMKSCRINIVIISKHSLRDDRFNEDREIAYAHRTASKVIHVILDQSESVQEIEGDLQQISKCFDFSVDDKPFEKLTDYMGTML